MAKAIQALKRKINAGIARSLNALVTTGNYVGKEVYTMPVTAATLSLNQQEQSVSNTISKGVSGIYTSEMTE